MKCNDMLNAMAQTRYMFFHGGSERRDSFSARELSACGEGPNGQVRGGMEGIEGGREIAR